MTATMKLNEGTRELLRCPVCQAALSVAGDRLHCGNPQCAALFPILDGIPILINDAASLFSVDDFVQRRSTTFPTPSALGAMLASLRAIPLPDIGQNLKARANYARLAALLRERDRPRVLVLGGSIVGKGMEHLLAVPGIEFVETDVSFGSRTALICDAHDIPFADGAFDGVVAQAVLEHVLDPQRCVSEIHRVLKVDGLVYAETPFMQQVHMGRYDFTRFTHLGHRRLFRQFAELDSGAVGGPGMVLAWSWRYFLVGFVRSRAMFRFVAGLTRVLLFWLKYFDHYLIDTRGTLDGASGYYFLGRRSEHPLPDRELITLYRGIQ